MVNNADYSGFGENRSTHVHARARLRSPATAATVALTAQQGRVHTYIHAVRSIKRAAPFTSQ